MDQFAPDAGGLINTGGCFAPCPPATAFPAVAQERQCLDSGLLFSSNWGKPRCPRGRDGKPRLHAKFGARWLPLRRENDGAQARRCTQRCFQALRARAVPGIVHTCIPPGASGALLHFGAVGRPPDPRLRTRDPGRFEHQSTNAGVRTHAWVMLGVLSEFGCLSLRFGFDRPRGRGGSNGGLRR